MTVATSWTALLRPWTSPTLSSSDRAGVVTSVAPVRRTDETGAAARSTARDQAEAAASVLAKVLASTRPTTGGS